MSIDKAVLSECFIETRSDEAYLKEILALDQRLYHHFYDSIQVDKNLTRQWVSFQANKNESNYRWYKYKEAFSANLVEYLILKYEIPLGRILDPFAGAGTTLFLSAFLGYDSEGIELLPIGQEIIKSRITAQSDFSDESLARLEFWKEHKPWKKSVNKKPINTLRITAGAYSDETEKEMGKYLHKIREENDDVGGMLFFTLLCVLESISFTRKDGQYLRWDYRSGRRQGKNKFNKGEISSFEEAISNKLDEIVCDIKNNSSPQGDLFTNVDQSNHGKVNLYSGSTLEVMPQLETLRYNAIITSPPYCNRYDYTRTYALEHALLGISEVGLRELRQQMVSCTVENRQKELMSYNQSWKKAITICDQNNLLQVTLNYLEFKKKKKELNNNGIARMVRGYFYEMACILQECYRVLRAGGIMFMVNDNVRYAGASISVDLILSSIAECLGFNIKNILVLPQGKGNSSQQMGAHGRDELRKCIYVWEKK
ncbi:MAG: DNA methyltransferase [Waddliaceae bacterium]